MSQDPQPTHASESSESRQEMALARVQHALHGLRYGTITLIVQDGVVVQIERTEKFRLKRP